LRIAFVAPGHPYRGGIAHFAARLAQQMSANDDVLQVNFTRLYPDFLFPGKTQYDESAQQITFPSERLIDSLNPLSWKRAASRIKEWKADALVFHYWHPFFAPAYRVIANSIDSTSLMICHNVTSHESGLVQSKLAKLAFGAMDGFLVHAKQEENEIRQSFPHSPISCAFHPLYDVFPNTNIERSDARAALQIDEKAAVVLYFGLIRPYKGVDILLEAASRLGDIPNLRIIIVGEVYGDRAYLDQALQKTPRWMVTLIDKYIPNEEVAKYFRAANIVALPYRSATQSGIIPIAYACNQPVIATRVGGLPDAIIDGESGYLIDPENPVQLAKTIHRYFSELGAPDMSEGIAKMRERLGWGRYAEILRSLIQEAFNHAD